MVNFAYNSINNMQVGLEGRVHKIKRNVLVYEVWKDVKTQEAVRQPRARIQAGCGETGNVEVEWRC